MTNKEAIEHINLILLRDRDNELHFVSHDEEIALDLAIKALEEPQLDIKSLKMDLPELFRPSYDGGYLKEGEEE